MASNSSALLIGVACVVGVASLAIVGYVLVQMSRSARKSGMSWREYLRHAGGRAEPAESEGPVEADGPAEAEALAEAAGAADAAATLPLKSRFARALGRIDLPLVTMLLVALAIRVSWVLLIQPASWDIYRDSIAYDRMAGWMVKAGVFSMSDSLPLVSSAFYTPGFPLFAAVVYAVVGSTSGYGTTAVYVAQAFVSVAVLFVMYRIGLRMYGRTVGLLAVALGAVYWPFVMANNLFLTEVLFMLCLCLLVLASLRLLDRASWGNAAVVGLLLGVCCLVRPVVVAWGVVPFLFLLKKVPLRRLALMAGVAIVGFVLVMTPWWVRNAVVFDRFVPFTTSSANPLLVGTYYGFPGEGGIGGDPFNIVTDSPQQELDNNAKWQKLALGRLKDQIENQPGDLLRQRLQLTRTALTWPYDAAIWNVPAWVKGRAVAAQTALMLIGLAGFMIGWRSRKSWMLFTLVVYFVVVHAVILIFNRYLFPVMPIIILSASYAIVSAARYVRTTVRMSRKRTAT